MLYEQLKHDGSLPIIGVNTFLGSEADAEQVEMELARSSDTEKRDRIAVVEAFRERHAGDRPEALARLRSTALSGGNVFAELMHTVRCCTLGEITEALFEVGGQYRRNV